MSTAIEAVSIRPGTLAKGQQPPAPWADGWPSPVVVALQPTPLDAQPSAYVQKSWEDRAYGATKELGISAIAGPGGVALRIEWACPKPNYGITDNDIFADACGVILPADGVTADLENMGSDAHPAITWYWRSGADAPFAGTVRGLGTVERAKEHKLTADAAWEKGRWAVVLSHPIGAGLPAGIKSLPVAFAVWNGANAERAGIAAYSPAWHTLELG